MGFTDTVDNKIKRKKSERNEKEAIRDRMDSIKDSTEAAAEEIIAIGQYFWKKYIAGEYIPDSEIRESFDRLDEINEHVRDLNLEIDNLKIAGIKDREDIDRETRARIEEKEALKEEKAYARAQAKAAKGRPPQ